MSDPNTRKNIRAATVLWMGSVLLSRMMGFVREIVIARVGGANADTDVYFTAFTIPDFVNYLLAGGALSITFIPIFAGYMAEDREEEGWRVFSIITTFLAVVLGIGIAVAMVFADRLAPLVASGFNEAQRAQLTYLTRIILPAQFFHFQGFLLSAVQMAKGQHKFAALAPLVYNGGTILGGLVLGSTLGMEGFAWGILGGAFVGSFLMQIYGARKIGLRWWPTLELRNKGFIRYLKLSLPIMVGQSLVAWDEWLIRYFGSFLAAASISWLNYGRKLAMVPQAVFGQAAGVASYPYLARQAAEGNVGEVYDALIKSVRGVLVMALGVQVFLMILAQELCYVLFRSSRFSDGDVTATAEVLTVFALGIGAWSVHGLVARGYYAFRDTLTPTLLGTGLMVMAIPLYALLAKHWAHQGLALASVIAMVTYATTLYLGFIRKVRKKDPTLVIPSLLPFLGRLVGACAITFGISLAVHQGLMLWTGPGSSLAQALEGLLAGLGGPDTGARAGTWTLSLLRGAAVGAVGGPILILTCLLFGVPEIRAIVQNIGSRLVGAQRAERFISRFVGRTP